MLVIALDFVVYETILCSMFRGPKLSGSGDFAITPGDFAISEDFIKACCYFECGIYLLE